MGYLFSFIIGIVVGVCATICVSCCVVSGGRKNKNEPRRTETTAD
jgi:hypothetical protein